MSTLRQFLSADDVKDIDALVRDARAVKRNPLAWSDLGRNKAIGLIFMNPSLRTRLSTHKAAANLGMNVMVMNVAQDGWTLEMNDGVVMDGGAQEHVKEAARVVSQYCDVIGIRTFASLQDRDRDYSEEFLMKFVTEASVPVVNMESATVHPLQSLADVITIEEHKLRTRPKVVLTWAPHPRALPQAVANSFAQWMNRIDVDLVIAHPEGYELDDLFAGHAHVTHDQDAALKGADFVYAKNWSATEPYGAILSNDPSWMITGEKMKLTDGGKFMHCLPVRRNVVVADEVLDGPDSIVIEQAANREYATQIVLKRVLEWTG